MIIQYKKVRFIWIKQLLSKIKLFSSHWSTCFSMDPLYCKAKFALVCALIHPHQPVGKIANIVKGFITSFPQIPNTRVLRFSMFVFCR